MTTTLIVIAEACTYEARPGGFTSRTHKLMAKALARDEAQIKTCADIPGVLADMASRTATTYAGSFFVHCMLKGGQRAPSGFRKRTWVKEVDRDTQAVSERSWGGPPSGRAADRG